MKQRVSWKIMALLITLVLLSAGVNAEELTKVRIATLPYFDYTGFVAAKRLGLDKELGLDFEFVSFPLEGPAAQALMRGSIDVTQGAIGSFVPIMPQTPELRVFLNNVQFKGFVFIGREGKIKTYDDFKEIYEGDFEKAQQATLEQFKGKTFLLVKSSFESMLRGALEQVGLTLDDVTIFDFQNDSQAAVAYLRGFGDLYTGSLPQSMRLLSEPGHVAVADNEVLGPAGLWYSNSAVTEEFLENEPDIVLKLAAVYYRFLRYLHEEPDETLQYMIDYLNQHAATSMDLDEAKTMKEDYEDFATIESSLVGVYDPDSPLYWKLAAEYLVNQNAELGKVPHTLGHEWIVQEEIFYQLLEDDELLSWIQSPLK